MTDTASLIARLEKATGLDRELDLAIHLAVEPEGDIAGLMKFRRGLDGKPGMAWDIHHGGSVCFEKYNESNQCFYNGGYPLPKYSSSIDAAMTLVDPRCAWSISKDIPGSCEAIAYGHDIHASADHATPALALCIAALRARSQP